ncbi:CPBP family intramembrane metalloprotease [Chryseobacterium lacus]|uniref:CPBP family intramembrane metalloprotease n=1 Tax=Chryseobacterium lacus TaxID=2058346 RepID=A0A368MYK8_9FLAO|nr:CPBP family intramembrane glutamic endopeptidase [Chryseobacterium lacus]RCU42474.1 CPBP family intramembrane metalloprotease [Chryseobacterium lacus]RST27036.1 CPBP family intramembrane metalloprotease [Chryseobacterium lacus]
MIYSLLSTAKSLLNFLKKPADQQDTDQSAKQQSRALFSVLMIDIPVMLLLSGIIALLNDLGWVKTNNHRVGQFLQFAPVWMVYLLAVIVIPFFEELIFRLFLRWRRNYILQLFVAVFPKTKSSVYHFWNRRYGVIFYLSAAAFALAHILNYEDENSALYFLPLLILPQFIAGLFSGYLRVRYNFMLGYFNHALHNAIFVSIAIWSTEMVMQQKLGIDNDRFSLKIEGVSRAGETIIHDYQQDSLHISGVDLQNVISTLTYKDVDLISTNNESQLMQQINVSYIRRSAENINRDSLIMSHLAQLYSFGKTIKHRRQKVQMFSIKSKPILMKHAVQDHREMPSSSTVTSDKITFKNVSLKEVASLLSNSYKIRFESDPSIEERFNLELPNRNLSQLRAVLQFDYGIFLKETEKQIDYVYIEFK